tara:strand:+ start:6060 stop:7382 length:1323 start_codon:yes stop_codon:yes gene_type:complete
MKSVYRIVISMLCLLFLFSCSEKENDLKGIITAEYLHQLNKALEASIVEDFFSPPVASRIYVYPNIAAYEILSSGQEQFTSLSNFMNTLESIPMSDDVNKNLSALYAFYHSSKALVYTSSFLDNYIATVEKEFKEKGGSKEVLLKANEYGKLVANHILKWANKDQYPQMRSMPEYQLKKTPGSWVPTLPDYSAALEPHWNKLRSFTLDSASQFKPATPTAFSMKKGSAFYEETQDVYTALNNNTKETKTIAKFWDCNPLVRQHQGHVTFAEKKLTPGGHWVNIARIAMKEKKQNIIETAHSYTLLCIGISDAFISCWDEKYRSNYIRPVTVIQQYIDPKWKPILYTPNFPEYPSGHSVVSSSAATILTHIFGENYTFTDNTEVPYGMAPRTFNSFIEASKEAAISRLYGGIHFMPAIENGKIQGVKVGEHVLDKLQLKAQ